MDQEDLHPKLYLYKRIVAAKLYIDQHYHEKIDLNAISDRAHFSKYHFLRLFKSAFGKSPHKYLTEVRLEQAKKLLSTNNSLTEVCLQVGFESVPSFVSLFKKQVGIPPNEYLKNRLKQQAKVEQQPLSFVPNCFIENHFQKK